MSGTSQDGVDVALIETDGEVIARFGPTAYRTYSKKERALLRSATAAAANATDRTARGAFTRSVLAAIDREDDPRERALLGDTLRYGLQALGGGEVGLR